jgi:hypothetical protein
MILLATGRVRIQRGSAKWIFDVEIEKLRADFFLHVEKTKIVLGEQKIFLIDRMRKKFYGSISTFTELTFHDFSLAPHQNIDITAK